jgi:hypothetical protein
LSAAPEWNLWTLALGLLTGVGAFWHLLLWTAAPLFCFAAGLLLWNARRAAREVWAGHLFSSSRARFRTLALTTLLHVLQPIARLTGRIEGGLGPSRTWKRLGFLWPWSRSFVRVDAQTRLGPERVVELRDKLLAACATVESGGAYDGWDLCVRAGLFGSARLELTTEEHRWGQLLRLRCRPAGLGKGLFLAGVVAALAVLAGVSLAWPAAGALGVIAVLVAAQTIRGAGGALAALVAAIGQVGHEHPGQRGSA